MYTGVKHLAKLTGSITFCTGMAAALAAGILGRLSDAWGHKRTLVACTVATYLVLLAHAFADSLAYLFVVRTLFGMTVAGMIPAANAIIKGGTSRQNIGKVYGVATSLSGLGWVIGPMSGGFIAASFGLRMPFLVAAAGMILVLLLVITCIKKDAGAGVQPSG